MVVTMTERRSPGSTAEEAAAFAERLRQFWAERGFAINVWIEPLKLTNGRPGADFAVKSDLVGGLPKSARPWRP
jgi:hypothetical protein